MKRIAIAAPAAAGLAVLLLGLAPAAHADVTNPADNPHKIVVKGDDGQTYVDGQDTLPGYDDEECTYIPGAWFDFDKNRVYYADGQWIPWTEWDRATGYKDWLAKKNSSGSSSSGSSGSSGSSSSGSSSSGSGSSGSGSSGSSSSGSSSSGSSKSGSGTSTSTKSSSTKSSSTKSGSSSSSTTSGKTTQSGKTTTTGTDDEATTGDPSAAPTVSADPGASPAPSVSAVPAIGPDVSLAEASATPDAVAASGPDSGGTGNGAGLVILGGLGAAGGLAYGATWFLRRRKQGGLA